MMLFSVGVLTFAAPSVGHHMLRDSYVASVHDVLVIMGLLRQHVQGSAHAFELPSSRTSPSVDVVSCTCHH